MHAEIELPLSTALFFPPDLHGALQEGLLGHSGVCGARGDTLIALLTLLGEENPLPTLSLLNKLLPFWLHTLEPEGEQFVYLTETLFQFLWAAHFGF